MRKAFTLIELLIIVGIIIVMLGIVTAAYRKAKWNAGVARGSVENRQKLNQAVAEGKFRSQKKFEEEQARLKRQTEIGLKQGH